VTTSYNQIAGRSIERIAALSDGVFAIAMTLIVLGIRVPNLGSQGSETGLFRALVDLAPQFVTYLLSFLTLGIFWNGQQTQLHYLARANRDLAWIHLAFLAAVALMPFSASLLAYNIGLRLALVVYWANIFVLGVVIYAGWRYATRAGLVREDVIPEMSSAIARRITAAQILYAFGALLCIFDTGWSIGFIVLVQLNFAIAPRIPYLADSRLPHNGLTGDRPKAQAAC